MVWDFNQEGCIDKFGGKVLLSVNQKKNIILIVKKILEFVVWFLNYLNMLCICICIDYIIYVVNKNNDI